MTTVPSPSLATLPRKHATGTVLRAVSGWFDVRMDEGGATLLCTLRGRLKREKRRSGLVVAGDRVVVEPTSERDGAITQVLERRSWLVRREPGPRGAYFDDVVVANVDAVVVCGAATEPPFQPTFVDRFLVAAALGRVDGIIAVTKRDELEDEGPEREDLAVALETYRRIGIPVVETSARTGLGIDALKGLVAGKTVAFVGKSGVGKSSLVNALCPGLGLAVGSISDVHKKGKHTTRVASLHPFERGYLVDTPGLRELGLPRLAPDVLTRLFPEMARLGACQFTSCTHEREPGCIVRAAFERGEIAQSRMESFRRLLRDA